MLEKRKAELFQLHPGLPKNNLVAWMGSNVSAWDAGTALVVIKRAALDGSR